MIFVDETGNRWKKIKVTTLFGAGFAVLTLSVLVVGSLVTPQWGQISIIKQAAQAVSSSGQSVLGSLTQTSHPSKPAPKQSSTNTVASATSANTSKSVTTATPKPTPAATPTPTPTASTMPATSKKDYGNSHNPTH